MKKQKLLFLFIAITITSCGGPLGKLEIKRDVVAEINTGSKGGNETIVRGGVEYQIEHSGAHPAISWAVGPKREEASLKYIADWINYGDADALGGNRYTFLKECDGKDSIDSTIYPVVFRIFEYTDKDTLYIFRDVGMDGYKFRTFIVVRSWHRPEGNYLHSIIQHTNEREEIKHCLNE